MIVQLKQQFHQALSNIFSAKLRSFLAVLGILVGTASVVALVISGQLATQAALKQFNNKNVPNNIFLSFYTNPQTKPCLS